MTVLHVREQGAVVRRAVEQIKVTHRPARQGKETVLHRIPVRELEQLALYGNVQVTTQAVALLLEHKIDVAFLSQFGVYRGRLQAADDGKFAQLRHAQLRISGDERQCLPLALAIVRAKLANQRTLLGQLATTQAAHAANLDRATKSIESMRQRAGRATTLDELRGYEGRGAASYFGALKPLLATSWNFQGRNFFPARDPFNALLSFGYGLLRKDITAAIHLAGLDPHLGCFHALAYDRPSLPLDLMEEFRPLTVDAPLLDLVLNGELTPADFSFSSDLDQPVTLAKGKVSPVIRAYERRLSTTTPYGPRRARETLRRCFTLQAWQYRRVVLGEQAAYEGVVG